MLSMVEVGGQAGYQVPLGFGVDAQLGVGTSVAWFRTNGDADHGQYSDHTRMITVGATLSAVRSF